jgi:hypothetical protein
MIIIPTKVFIWGVFTIFRQTHVVQIIQAIVKVDKDRQSLFNVQISLRQGTSNNAHQLYQKWVYGHCHRICPQVSTIHYVPLSSIIYHYLPLSTVIYRYLPLSTIYEFAHFLGENFHKGTSMRCLDSVCIDYVHLVSIGVII